LRIAAREELAATLIDLLLDPTTAKSMGTRAKTVFDAQAGATARAAEAIKILLATGTAKGHAA
jgi:hypothetical protein